MLMCLMKAKTFVKTPFPFYVYFSPPDSMTNNVKYFNIEKFIEGKFNSIRYLDEELPKIDFFKNNVMLQQFTKFRCLFKSHKWHITRRGFYKNGVNKELNRSVLNAFKKHFGEFAIYPTLLFHWISIISVAVPNQDIEEILFNSLLPLIQIPDKSPVEDGTEMKFKVDD